MNNEEETEELKEAKKLLIVFYVDQMLQNLMPLLKEEAKKIVESVNEDEVMKFYKEKKELEDENHILNRIRNNNTN